MGRRQGLLGEQVEARDAWALRARAAAIVLVVVVSAGLAWVNTTAAKYCWVLIPVVQWAAERRSARPGALILPAAADPASCMRCAPGHTRSTGIADMSAIRDVCT